MSDKDNIFTLSLLRLLSEGRLDSSRGHFYKDECFVMIMPQEEELKGSKALFQHPTRLDCHALLLCSEGCLNITCNLQETVIGPNMVFFTQPGSIIQVNSDAHIAFAVVLFNEQYFERLNISIHNLLPHIGAFNGLFIFQLPTGQFQYLWRQVEMLAKTISQSNTLSYYDEMVRLTSSALAYCFVSLLIQELEAREKKGASLTHNREEEIFRRFMRLVGEHYRTERRIAYYADLMHLTPKYMSSVVRHASGHGPAEWINQNVLIEAKSLLRYSNMSIQEITYTLNFPNQSFFGRWFKGQTGVSPKKYREGE